jgi:hypothetical protein
MFLLSHGGFSMAESIAHEVRGAKFGDRRLTNRLEKIVDRLGAKPNMSIPAAMNGRAEMEAAYRFFDNSKVTGEAILDPHIAATDQRIRENDVVLLVQDTTELDLTRPEQQVVGAGPIECESRRGAFHHPLVAFDTNGLPLGTVWSKSWAREKNPNRTHCGGKTQTRQKHSYRKKREHSLAGGRPSREGIGGTLPTNPVCLYR